MRNREPPFDSHLRFDPQVLLLGTKVTSLSKNKNVNLSLYFKRGMQNLLADSQARVIECHTRSLPDRTIHGLPAAALPRPDLCPRAVQVSTPCFCNTCI